jgi:hypothetical protein
MYSRTALLLAGMLLISLAAMPLRVVAAAPPRLIVTPTQGHAGDQIFLSGSGFTAGQPVSIRLRCGRQLPSTVAMTMAGRLGRFAGAHIRLAAPGRVGKCVFSAAPTAAPHVRTKAVPYTFVAPGRPLSRCALLMCLRVQAFLVRLKNDAKGNIVISGWPGAIADVTVARTPTGAKHRELRLNWRGVGSVSTVVAPGLLKGLKARVFVRAHLGRISGQSVTAFHVMFGNR